MRRVVTLHNRLAAFVSGRLAISAVLVLTRLALAGIFWRSGRAKVVEGSWLTISDATHYLFAEEYRNVPLPPPLATVLATGAEHLLPMLLVLGLATRYAALGLAGMTMVIQIFVFPQAWWPVHSLWLALALILVTQGGGLFSLDVLLVRAGRR